MFGMKDILDSLLDEAKEQEFKRKFKKMPAAKSARQILIEEKFKTIYSEPTHWTEGKPVAIVHRSSDGTETLLGAFQEFNHHRSGARKLTRTDKPVLIDHTEYVTGDWWLHPAPTPPDFGDNPEGIVDIDMNFDLEFSELQVLAKNVPITIRREKGWTRSVRLRERTQFVCPVNRTIVYFPKNLCVLEAMSFANKIALKSALESSATP